jgi:8-oxo-dGTP pyrophosphatase MutT (NUDIX family)
MPMNVVKRGVVRAAVLDADNRVLLFHTRDPSNRELDMWWELPGGGIDPAGAFS